MNQPPRDRRPVAGRAVDPARDVTRRIARPDRRRSLPAPRSASIDKDATAREVARQRGIQQGRACAITAVELHPTFTIYKTILVRRRRPCGVLYQYQIHPQLGWMYARMHACGFSS